MINLSFDHLYFSNVIDSTRHRKDTKCMHHTVFPVSTTSWMEYLYINDNKFQNPVELLVFDSVEPGIFTGKDIEKFKFMFHCVMSCSVALYGLLCYEVLCCVCPDMSCYDMLRNISRCAISIHMIINTWSAM